jgi:flagellar biosynthesis/type III secretory pathway M-ring protein FliF/YscJ
MVMKFNGDEIKNFMSFVVPWRPLGRAGKRELLLLVLIVVVIVVAVILLALYVSPPKSATSYGASPIGYPYP